jgi:4-hydroxybutyrate CoA-transferase
MAKPVEYQKKLISLDAAAKKVQNGDIIATPLAIGACSTDMYNAILARHNELRNVKIMDTVQVRPCKLYDPEYMKNLEGQINYMPAFGIAPMRKMGSTKAGDFYPVMASDLHDKFAHRADIFIAMITPPNKFGYVNLGLTNFYSMETIRQGRESGKLRVTIGEVNDQMPIVHGNNWMHISEFDYFVENSTPMPTFGRGAPTERDKTIAQYVLDLIKDGDTIQMGIGGIPEAVVAGLDGKKDLGVLTEMFPGGLPGLVEKGIVTNKRKPFHTGVTVATFGMGDQEMYDYLNDNQACELHPASYTNNPRFVCQHPNMVCLNMALLVDFSGQIDAEGLSHNQISGVGGQLDFAMGAYWSEGGKSITLISAAKEMPDGKLASSIVPELPPGTPVSVPRTYADYIITEYGVAHLRYKSRRERAEELISIAHPDLRAELRKSMRKNFYPQWSQAAG